VSGAAAAVLPDDAVARLRLLRTRGVGPVTYRQLVARFGGAEAAIEALPMLARRGGGNAPQVAGVGEIRAELAAIARVGGRAVFLDDPEYPPLLREIDTAPPMLVVRGDAGLARRPCVAIVGARNASAAACRFARELAHGLAQAGATVVSGLARGIDTAAHVGSLPGTVGVIASGIDIAFPPENARLQEEIATRGLLLAEQPPGTQPLARHFPSRNRIIAGIAQGTVVVEAAPRSGSLITARLAAESGREVMAVPGHPSDPRAQGCNGLIREGATLVQTAADVLELIRPIDARSGMIGGVRAPAAGFGAAPAAEPSERERAEIVGLLGPVPVSVDELVRQSGATPAAVQLLLLELELAGRLDRHAGGRVSLSGG